MRYGTIAITAYGRRYNLQALKFAMMFLSLENTNHLLY
jgi:hypothetical protein